MHAEQHLRTVRHDLAAVEAYVRKLLIQESHAERVFNEARTRRRTMQAVRDRLLAERDATVRGRRRKPNSKKSRELTGLNLSA